MSEEIIKGFDYSAIPQGFYDQVATQGSPVRRAWHLQKFERILDCLPEQKNMSVLDIGCFAGTFLSLLDSERFSTQVGVDIVKTQIQYANERYATDFRTFQYLPNLKFLKSVEGTFDCVTLIEVIEHLTKEEIKTLFSVVTSKIKPGGCLVLSTPNYASTWPLLEILVNLLSEVSYEEQHLTKFNYFTVERKLRSIVEDIDKNFKLEFKTTTHFCTPFLAGFSLSFAAKLSRMFRHNQWKFPFGNLLLLKLKRL